MGSLSMGPASLKRQCHLVARRRGRRGNIRACRFGRGLAVQLRIGVEKSKTVSLPGRERFAEQKSQPRRWMRDRCIGGRRYSVR